MDSHVHHTINMTAGSATLSGKPILESASYIFQALARGREGKAVEQLSQKEYHKLVGYIAVVLREIADENTKPEDRRALAENILGETIGQFPYVARFIGGALTGEDPSPQDVQKLYDSQLVVKNAQGAVVGGLARGLVDFFSKYPTYKDLSSSIQEQKFFNNTVGTISHALFAKERIDIRGRSSLATALLGETLTRYPEFAAYMAGALEDKTP